MENNYNNIDRTTLALRLAKALLIYKGDITLEDIKALPLLDNDKDAKMIYNYLSNQYHYLNSEKFEKEVIKKEYK